MTDTVWTMDKPFRIWLDDERLPPPNYNVWFKTHDGVDKLPDFVKANADRIEAISFDNSLGCHVEGHQLLNQLEAMVCADGLRLQRLQELCVHTGDSNQSWPMLCACDNIAKLHAEAHVYRTDYDRDCRERCGEDFSAYTAWRNTEFQGEVF